MGEMEIESNGEMKSSGVMEEEKGEFGLGFNAGGKVGEEEVSQESGSSHSPNWHFFSSVVGEVLSLTLLVLDAKFGSFRYCLP